MERTPRWVKVTAALIAVLVAMTVVMLVAGGEHGPGRHGGPGGGDGTAPTLGVTDGHRPPPGVDHGTP